MTPTPVYRNHLTSSASLITTREAKRAGFVVAVFGKEPPCRRVCHRCAYLRVNAETVSQAEDLLQLTDIRSGLLTAAGVSDKAVAHLDMTDRREILRQYIDQVLVPAGDKFVEELVYRFLLTRGDTLGGKIRNLVGVWAQRKLSDFIVSNRRMAGRDFQWFHKEDGKCKKTRPVEIEDVDQIRAFAWTTGDTCHACSPITFWCRSSRPRKS